MRLLFESDAQKARLEQDAHGSVSARLLLADDWLPLCEYVYDRRYVYAAAINGAHRYSCLVARGGRHESSLWWTPDNKDVPVMGLAGLSVTHWKPLPDHVDSYHPLAHWEELTGHRHESAPSRPPEPVYECAPPTARLTPGPRALLFDMAAGAVLRERGQRWSSWTLQRPGQAAAKITERPVGPLRQAAFIARDGVLPTDPERWYEFDWNITDAGRSWLTANA